MKIRLIEPKPAGAHVFGTSVLPRLGLPLIATMLNERGHDVKVYVESFAPVDWDDVTSADIVGLSATTATVPAAYAIADGLKYLGVPTVIGGSHVTFMADEALGHCNYVVRGEGHFTMLELLDGLGDDACAVGHRRALVPPQGRRRRAQRRRATAARWPSSSRCPGPTSTWSSVTSSCSPSR